MIDATLVTIHGLFSSPATWNRLTAVWRADTELQGLRIHPFGYESPRRPSLPFSRRRIPDYNDIAQTFATEYANALKDEANIAIVTHSQGGLILQRFLEWMLNQGKGQDLGRIRTVVMLACPNGGSEYLESIRGVLGLSRHPQVGNLDVFNRAIADTQRQVLEHIVHAEGIGEHHCHIPFHAYAGSSDNIVKPASAQSAFPYASTLTGDHRSILDPAATGNRTAETVKRHILDDLPASRARARPAKTIDSPYRGLRAFGEDDVELFFGRERVVGEVLDKLSGCVTGTGLVVVSGVSGAGKSSLLSAGVLPKLQKKGLPSAPQAAGWPCVRFTPTASPLDELAARIAPVARADASAVRRALENDPAGFRLTAQAGLHQDGERVGEESGTVAPRVLLIVDQFETLFTQCEKESERKAFITALAAASERAAMVVLVVRNDFEARLSDYQELTAAVQDRYLLTAMSEWELRQAITGPAFAVGSKVDNDLVNVLLEEFRAGIWSPGKGSQPVGAGTLPLLSHALDQAWRGRVGNVLTLKDYKQTGGIVGAVASSAQRIYNNLSPAQQDLARQVFIRLTATTADRLDTAARVSRADLVAGKDEAQTRDAGVVVDSFVAGRLLTLGGTDGAYGSAASVEISHEVVLTAWPQLCGWLADTRTDRVARTRLDETVFQWTDAGRDRAYLYKGSQLDAAVKATDRIKEDKRHSPLSSEENDFLRASKRAKTWRVWRWRLFTAVLAGLVVLTATGFGLARVDANNATNQTNLALSGQLAVLSESLDHADPVAASLLAAAAWQKSHTPVARESMLSVVAQPARAVLNQRGGINWAGFSPGRATVLATAGTKVVQLWDPVTHRAIGAPWTVPGGANSAAFNPSGTELATAGMNGTVQLWNLATRRQAGSSLIASTSNGVSRVAFSPNGTMLATADGDGTARLWDLSTGHQAGAPLMAGNATPGVNQVLDVAFSPNGKILATASQDGTARLWDVKTHRQIGPAMTDGNVVTTLASMDRVLFSPDGATLATLGSDDNVLLWSVSSQHRIGPIIREGAAATDIAFGKAVGYQGAMLAIGESDGVVDLWDVATQSEITALDAEATGDIPSIDVSPDGTMLATVALGGVDGTATLWDLKLFHPVGPSAPIGLHTAAAPSPDGRSLAVVGFDRAIRVWSLVTDRPAGPPIPASGPSAVTALVFSPDGRLLATGDGDGFVRLWSLATGRQVGQFLLPLPAKGFRGVAALVFSPDGRLLATGDSEGFVRLWSLATGDQAGPVIEVHATVKELGFSPDGGIIATVDSKSNASLWDARTPHPTALRTFSGVEAVAFSPDGTKLATAELNGIAQLWSVATGRPIGPAMVASALFNVEGVAFSRDGTLLATAADDGTARLFNVATGHEIGPTLQAGPVGDTVSLQDVAFSADGTTLATFGPSLPATLWDVALPTDLVSAACSIAVGHSLSQDWSTYVESGAPYVRACQ